MVNSLPNVARQLAKLGMVSVPNLQALRALCDGRDAVLGDIEAYYGLTGSPALGETASGAWPRACPSGCYTAAAMRRGSRRTGWWRSTRCFR